MVLIWTGPVELAVEVVGLEPSFRGAERVPIDQRAGEDEGAKVGHGRCRARNQRESRRPLMPSLVPLPAPLPVAMNLCVMSITEPVTFETLWDTANSIVSPGWATSLGDVPCVAIYHERWVVTGHALRRASQVQTGVRVHGLDADADVN